MSDGHGHRQPRHASISREEEEKKKEKKEKKREKN